MKKASGAWELAHQWASGEIEENETKHGNASFDVTRRYRVWYNDVGWIVDDKHALLTEEMPYAGINTSYDYKLSNAVSHMTVVRAPRIPSRNPVVAIEDHLRNIRSMQSSIMDAIDKQSRARTSVYESYVNDKMDNLAAYCRLFKFNNPLAAFKRSKKWQSFQEDVARCRANQEERDREWNIRCERRQEALRQAREKKMARMEAEWPQVLEAWRNNERAALPSGWATEKPVALRLSEDGTWMQTSWGAQVSAQAAPVVWHLYQQAIESGEPVKIPPTRLGMYTMTQVGPDGIKVGCHNIPGEEIEMMAEKLNLK